MLLINLLADAADKPPMVTSPAGILAILVTTLALIFWAADHPVIGRVFKIIPTLVFCYFVPTALSTFDVIPHTSPLYDFVKSQILPASLILLILALDLPGIIRLGPKAGIMLLAGTAGVVIGAPVALLLFQSQLPPDIWKGLTALSGSWIGGGANFIALGNIAGASDDMIVKMVVPDVLIANIWMTALLFLALRQQAVDRWIGADASAIRDLERRMSDFQSRVARIATLSDLMIMLALAFGGAWVAANLGVVFNRFFLQQAPGFTKIIDDTAWKYILVTTFGLMLSFSRARNLEGAGASRLGSVMIYLLVACIGAHADFSAIGREDLVLILAASVWMLVHISILLTVAWLIKAPIFFVAVGSQANIGGAASAPIVASAFHPALAPVGVLLAVAGYALGTYAGIICMQLLKWAAGV